MVAAPETLNDLRRDLKRALDVMSERRDDYVRGREYYDGTRSEVFASDLVRKALERGAEAAPISLAHIPVDVIVDMVELTSVDSTASAETLAVVTEANEVEESASDWLRKAGYFGDYYVVIDPAEETSSGAIVPSSVRWVGASPLTSVVVYDRADDRTPVFGARVWQDDKTWHARLYYDDCTVLLVTAEGVTEAKAKAFDLDFVENTDEAFVFHDGGRMLIAHLAIDGRPYGTPLHRKAWGPQDAITKISASNLTNVEAVALPARWALLDPMAEIDDDIDDDFGTDGPTSAGTSKADGMTTATSGRSKARAVPGGIAYLSGIKEVGTFDNGDGLAFLANLDWYVRVMAVATGIALFEFDLKGDQPSGESRRRAMARALKKAKRVRSALGAFIEEVCATTLSLLGVDATVTASFYPIETSTDKEGIELVGLKIKNGVPVRAALLEAGYTDTQVDEWWPPAAPAVTVDMLTTLATALAQLGTAKTLGVINDQELRDMLPTILTAARGEGPTPVGV